MRVIFVVCLFISIGANCQRGNESMMTSRLDSLFSAVYTAEVPGAAVLVAQKGKIVYEKAFGSACLELHTALLSAMLFDLGSITKQFTAVAVLQLVEQGKIALNDSLQRFIPDFPYKGHTNIATRGTICWVISSSGRRGSLILNTWRDGWRRRIIGALPYPMPQGDWYRMSKIFINGISVCKAAS